MSKHIRFTLKSIALTLAFAILSHQPIQATEQEAPPAPTQSISINAKASLLMEANTGKILLEDNPHQQLAPASVTKVMTMLLIYEAIEQERIGWDQTVTVSAHAASMGGSQIFLEPEEKQTVRDLVKSIVIASANDAAVAMAEFVAGSEEAFVQLMNKRAGELGMKNTHFKNACGLDADGHLTTAHDIALMSRELIVNHPEVFEYTKVRLDKIIHKTARGEEEFGLTNTNRLIRSYAGATGLKTGSTGEALFCISATAEKDGMSLIAVVLGAPDPTTRFDSAMKLFDYGYAHFAIASQEEEGTPMGNITVYKGKVESTAVVVADQQHVLVPKGKNIVIDSEIKLDGSISAPVEKGAKAGEVVYTHDGNEVGRGDLVIPEDIEKAGVEDIMKRVLERWIARDGKAA
ncbi:MAG: D-alanyl-D-alanine carboxypeptidase [Defluviitaleaceae bacterium]|nr:D-alanyl-D-alanine carboxypeptidase [Defluviitaleaceae bacterium]